MSHGFDYVGVLTAIASAIATVLSVVIAAKVYYDSRTLGPDIKFVSREYKVNKQAFGSTGTLGGTHKLLFMNAGDKTGSMLSITFDPSSYANSGGKMVITASTSFPITIQPYTSVLIDAPFTITGTPTVESYFQIAQDQIAVNFNYEVTTKKNVEFRKGSFAFVFS